MAGGRGVGARPAEVSLRQAEAELIERICKGEKALFHDLIRPHEERVYVTALAILRNPADAEDVAQEAVLKAFKNLSQFRGESSFRTWLIRVTINEARMRLRKDRAGRLVPLEDTGPGQEEENYQPREFADWREIPSEELERREFREALAQALDSLLPIYREVFLLRDVHDLSIQQAAQTLGISAGAVKTRLLRARLMLRDLLAPGAGGAWLSGPHSRKGPKPWR